MASVVFTLAIGGCTTVSPASTPATPLADSFAPSPTPRPSLALATSTPSASPAIGWTATGKLNEPRLAHTATLLRDGKVLVAGGGLANDSAELYDPVTGTWRVTGRMTEGRTGHTATLLLDGSVLVVGGSGHASAERYDPARGTWAAAGSVTARCVDTATLLLDGRVLVAGGSSDDNRSTSCAALFDPKSGIWTATGSMSDGRRQMTATRLLDGKVWVAGGIGPILDAFGWGTPLKTAELYDPASEIWTATARMTGFRSQHTATLLLDGRVLVAGGDVPAEIYDPVRDSWTEIGPLFRRIQPAARLLRDGRVLVVGGASSEGTFLATADLYDPATDSWTAAGSMAEARFSMTTTLLLDGRVLVAGGYNVQADQGLASAELYYPGGAN